MSADPEAPGGANQLLDEASLWFARMRGPDATTHRPAFEAWLARGALHLAAYNRASEIFSMGKFLTEDARDEPAPSGSPPGRSRPWSWIVGAVTLGCLLLLVMGCFTNMEYFWRLGGSPASGLFTPGITAFGTAPGESRVERLADGSVVTLGPDSRLSVDFDDRQRRLTLTRGRARFEVAKESRAFVVAALGTRVTAHGTVFDVALGGAGSVKVRLFEGRIDIVSPSTSKRPEIRRFLYPGQAMEVPSEPLPQGSGSPHAGSGSGPSAELTGLRDFDAVRLADVVAEANRIAPVQIRLADSSLGDLRVSGRFRLDDPNKLAERMAAVFDLRIERPAPGQIVVTRR